MFTMLKLISSEEIISPILQEVAAKIETIDDTDVYLDTFWDNIDGPLVESIQGEPNHQLVTFLYREQTPTDELWVSCPAFGMLKERAKMLRLDHTDIYYRSVYILNRSILPYNFHRSKVITPNYPKQMFINWGERIQDPYNDNKDIIELDDGEEFVITYLSLPGAPQTSWSDQRDVASGSVAEFHIKARGRLYDKITNEIENTALDAENPDESPYLYQYCIYCPADYDVDENPYPLLVMNDAFAYTKEGLVNTPRILDNLIAAGKIPPICALFRFHRDRDELLPDDEVNEFFINEVLPEIRSNYNVSNDPADVIIGGSSLGGLNAMYMALHFPEVFGKVICQSGSFWSPDKPNHRFDFVNGNHQFLIEEYRDHPKVDIKIYMEVGVYETPEDLFGQPGQYWPNLHMRDILMLKGYDYQFNVFRGAHSYGNWRISLPKALIYLFEE